LGIISKGVEILVISAALAVYELFFKDLYKAWIISQGKTLGFAEMMLGYALILIPASIVAWSITRRLSHSEGEGNG